MKEEKNKNKKVTSAHSYLQVTAGIKTSIMF